KTSSRWGRAASRKRCAFWKSSLTGIASRFASCSVSPPDTAEDVRARPAWDRRPGKTEMPWFEMLLNLDHPRHVRMQRTKIFVVARVGEGEREFLVGIQGLGPEFAGRHHRMRNVVPVGPGHRRADLDLELGRLEDE